VVKQNAYLNSWGSAPIKQAAITAVLLCWCLEDFQPVG